MYSRISSAHNEILSFLWLHIYKLGGLTECFGQEVLRLAQILMQTEGNLVLSLWIICENLCCWIFIKKSNPWYEFSKGKSQKHFKYSQPFDLGSFFFSNQRKNDQVFTSESHPPGLRVHSVQTRGENGVELFVSFTRSEESGPGVFPFKCVVCSFYKEFLCYWVLHQGHYILLHLLLLHWKITFSKKFIHSWGILRCMLMCKS